MMNIQIFLPPPLHHLPFTTSKGVTKMILSIESSCDDSCHYFTQNEQSPFCYVNTRFDSASSPKGKQK